MSHNTTPSERNAGSERLQKGGSLCLILVSQVHASNPLPRLWLIVTLLVLGAKAQVRQKETVPDLPTAASEGRVFHKCVLTSPDVVDSMQELEFQ